MRGSAEIVVALFGYRNSICAQKYTIEQNSKYIVCMNMRDTGCRRAASDIFTWLHFENICKKSCPENLKGLVNQQCFFHLIKPPGPS